MSHLPLQVFYVESISNPLIGVADLEAVAAFSKQRGLTPVVDNTFATPVLLTPARLGFIVIHSATKFLNGHSDIMAGAVAGPADFIAKARPPLSLLQCQSRVPSAPLYQLAICS